jgi:hypothetical protein
MVCQILRVMLYAVQRSSLAAHETKPLMLTTLTIIIIIIIRRRRTIIIIIRRRRRTTRYNSKHCHRKQFLCAGTFIS